MKSWVIDTPAVAPYTMSGTEGGMIGVMMLVPATRPAAFSRL